MEEKVVKTNAENRDLVISKARLFEWNLIKEENGKLYFARDNETPYYQDLVKLELEYGEYRFLPFASLIIPAALAFICVTVLLILFFAQRDFAKNFWYIFIIPSGISLIIAVILTFLRMKTLDKVMNEKPKKDLEFQQKIKKLKENCK